jgi:hypothetical protein
MWAWPAALKPFNEALVASKDAEIGALLQTYGPQVK